MLTGNVRRILKSAAAAIERRQNADKLRGPVDPAELTERRPMLDAIGDAVGADHFADCRKTLLDAEAALAQGGAAEDDPVDDRLLRLHLSALSRAMQTASMQLSGHISTLARTTERFVLPPDVAWGLGTSAMVVVLANRELLHKAFREIEMEAPNLAAFVGFQHYLHGLVPAA